MRPNGDTALAGDIVNGSKVLVIYVQSPVDKFLLLSMPATSASISLAVGAVMAWPTENIPAGCLLADGSAVSRTTYAALFAAYGTRYGNGDGATTFNLPNYKDYFLRGHDASGTDAGSRADRGDGTTGANVGTKQTSATKSHSHAGTTSSDGAHTHSFGYSASVSNFTSISTYVTSIQTSGGNSVTTQSSGVHTHTVTTEAVGESANETRAKNVTVNWIIVATPAAALVTSGIGKNETWIGARSMTARVTSGAGSATRNSGASDITQPVFDFDASSQEYVHCEWVLPKRWNKGTVTFEALWTADAGTPGQTVAWTLAAVAISNADALNATFGSAQTATDALLATGQSHQSPRVGCHHRCRHAGNRRSHRVPALARCGQRRPGGGCPPDRPAPVLDQQRHQRRLMGGARFAAPAGCRPHPPGDTPDPVLFCSRASWMNATGLATYGVG